GCRALSPLGTPPATPPLTALAGATRTGCGRASLARVAPDRSWRRSRSLSARPARLGQALSARELRAGRAAARQRHPAVAWDRLRRRATDAAVADRLAGRRRCL